ncbi:MAG: hypothetical protein ACK5HS_03355 [Mycoplasmatales bacterium]
MFNYKRIFLDIFSNKKIYLLSSLITLILLILSLFIYQNLQVQYVKNMNTKFPQNIVYVDNKIIEPVSGSKVFKSPSLNDRQISKDPIDYVIKVNDLELTKDSTTSLSDKILSNVESNDIVFKYNVVKNAFPSIINDVVTSNDAYGIKRILVGNYPYHEQDILIPESIALNLVNNNAMTSYKELININIEYNNKQYNIVGVYEPQYNENEESIVTYSSNIDSKQLTSSFALTKDNKVTDKLINLYPKSISYLNNQVNFSPLFILLAFIVLLIVYYYFITETLSKSINLLNHYHKRLRNYSIYLISFIIYLILIILACIITLLI